MAMTDLQILRDIDRRIADMNQSLTLQIATLRADQDLQRQETRYYRRDILARLSRLEQGKGGSSMSLLQALDLAILIRVLIAIILAGTGIMSVAEAVKVATG
jgi:hypothetical protein